MKYSDSKFLFPVMAVTAWAQQPSPATREAEAALRTRAEQFFQLQVDKKYRQAEALVADDTKDNYYNGNKFSIKGFTIQRIELLDDNTRAKVTINGKVTLQIPTGGAVDLDAPSTTLWKLEAGQWVWYIDETAVVQTPFGPIKVQPGDGKSPQLTMPGKAPDIATLQNSVKIDRTSVELTAEAPEQTVSVSNELAGGVDLELGSVRDTDGFRAEIEKKHLEAGEKTLIHFTATKGKAAERVMQVLVSPLGSQLDIRVTKK
jgi:hypothetical protein